MIMVLTSAAPVTKENWLSLEQNLLVFNVCGIVIGANGTDSRKPKKLKEIKLGRIHSLKKTLLLHYIRIRKAILILHPS